MDDALRDKLIGDWEAELYGWDLLDLRRAQDPDRLRMTLRSDGTASWRDPPLPFGPGEGMSSPFAESWSLSRDRVLTIHIPVPPIPEAGVPGWSRKAVRYDVLAVSDISLALSNQRFDGEHIIVMRRVRTPIEERRGLAIGDFGYSDRFFFVQAPVEQVAGLYVERTRGTSWERDVPSRCMGIKQAGTVFYQLKGHTWTGVSTLRDHPLIVSRILNCKVVELSYQKTASALSYQIFDRGEIVESFGWSPDSSPSFQSRLREVDFSELSDISDMSDPRPFDPYAFIDAAFASVDLYAVHPPIDESTSPEGSDEVSSPGVLREDFERVDIVGAPSPGGRAAPG